MSISSILQVFIDVGLTLMLLLKVIIIVHITLMRKVLAVLSINPDYLQFAIPELKSILRKLDVPLHELLKDELPEGQLNCYDITHKTIRNFPFVTLRVPDFELHRKFFQNGCAKSVMINKFILLISQGQSYEQLIANQSHQILNKESKNQNELIMCQFFSRSRGLQREQQVNRIHKVLGGMNIRGTVSCSHAKKKYQLIEDHMWYHQHHKTDLSSTLRNIFFGIELCNNRVGKLKFNSEYQLPKRIYLGPTSTDNDLAFMMANQAKLQSGSFVYDPFVGTGGLLIPAAYMGAVTFGSDLDIRVLNGYSVGRINKNSPFYSEQKKFEVFTPKINLNFQQYGFLTPNIVRADSTSAVFRGQRLFDAIITDPPYGIRAMSRAVTKKKDKVSPQSEQVAKQSDSINKKEDLQSSINQAEDLSIKKQYTSNEIPQVVVNETQNSKELVQQQSSSQDQQKQPMSELTQEERERKRMRRKIQKQNRRKRKQALPEEEKQFKRAIVEKLNRERIDQWDKFDRDKIQNTERQKIFEGLLALGRNHLKVGGRLVFLYPIFQHETFEGVKSLPSHQGFDVIDMSENELSAGNSRLLVTLERSFQ